jgi:hypothetical protein
MQSTTQNGAKTMSRTFVYLHDGTPYSDQPTTGFSSEDNAHEYMERKSLLTPERYIVKGVYMRRSWD